LPQSPFSTSTSSTCWEVGAVGKQLAPQCHWVLARRVRHLVDEALDEEHVLGVASDC